ncbi:polymer-forming cytoskeletal protein [Roseobacter denitrificans]|uniref:Polymer-forming cytoskeletal protein n=1 Tax=Roseobacter denitrificans (strain ATCC 33942 / OCh 114) TaxID=375451 RepID=Q169K7_ROSDO|nr:polymer-forming cytoskeletal protein [Roseobacter denitrificans]ABG31336.1 conserved hypothetical protein [Roseobacter denitrificans OCh 114]AVL54366.1 polymer-forming cytoskeletal protein [Roseobacter denitrificans]SFF99678.1 Polymer-forming protein [Roseobacter denitrificans OCh 114]
MAVSTIEEDLTIKGNVSSKGGNVDIKGKVVGDVTAEAVLIHGTGSVDGALAARKIAVQGKHKGNLKCDDLTFASTAQVEADVSAQTLTTESGAKILGKVQISGG